MARKSNYDLLNMYRDNIEQSLRWRREDSFDDLWKRMVDMYRGKQYFVDSAEDRLLVNIAFATINVLSPSVSVNFPKITVNARNYDDKDRSIITEEIINYWWRHFECQDEFRRSIKDFLIIGHGWVKTGYRFVEEEQAVPGSYESADDLSSSTPESVTESTMIIKEDRPFVERIDPFDMYVDADATSMKDARWIAQRVRRPLEDVKRDKRYRSKARADASPSHYSKWGMESGKPRRPQSSDYSYVEIWEYYDIERNTMSIFCDGSDSFLVAPMEIPFSFGHPFTMIRNYDVPGHFYPMGELEAIEPLQRELNQTRTQMMNHRKRYSRKWLYKESAFDADGRSALESDEDNVMVPVISDESISSVVGPMPAVINPPEFYNQSELITNDINRVTGISDYARGALPEVRRTATEAGIIQDASNSRAADKLAIVERSIADVAKKLVQIAQQFLQGEQVVRLSGNVQPQLWLTFDRASVQGEFDFEVEAGSTQPQNESFRRQMAMQVVDAMAPFAGAGIIDMPKLAAYVLGDGFGIRSAESFVIQPQMAPAPVSPQGLPPEVGGMPPGMPPQMPQGMPPGMPPQM
jgi:hypothetical protein